ncbi:MAG: UDP-N-acetylmuramoyl-L-alanyl-D-glutamate--2,6-diaminopimelate ligase [Blastocatellia bacterium]
MTLLSDIVRELRAQASGDKMETTIAPASFAVTHDSRRVVPGGIFVAIKGATTDGNNFVQQATQRGALAVISEIPRPADFAGAWLQVADARAALAHTAAIVHGHPSRSLKLVGITGTNGKTTTAHLCEAIFRAAGAVPAMMGTISHRIGEQEETAEHTTPEASHIQDFLRRAVEAGAKYAVMEVSSIALDLQRVDALDFAVAAFTNLTQDHLDYHGTMEAYAAAKRKLFVKAKDFIVVNVDDAYGAQLPSVTSAEVLSYALDSRADLTADRNDFGVAGLSFTARTPLGDLAIRSPLVGRPHAYNILCAVGIGIALGIDAESITCGIGASRGAAGRFERVSAGEDDITVVVDYAHTPDALVNVLQMARDTAKTTGGRVITVFGCGGDRDKLKRLLMGQAAAQLSEHVIATSDNPRSEDPLLILHEIEAGLKQANGNYELIEDRRAAIFQAIVEAKRNDVIVIAGKGHEDYQILASGKIHFDDREVAQEALRERKSRD